MDLAVGASSDAVTSLLGKIGSVLSQQYGLIRGVRDDIRYINDEMASMQAFLTVGYKARYRDEQRRVWMKQVRDMVYDIEDVNHRLGPAPRGNGKLMFLRKAWYVLTTLNERRCVATEIHNLRAWAQEISDRRMRYTAVEMNLQHRSGEEIDEWYRPTPTYHTIAGPAPEFICKQPVCMEDAIEELRDWIMCNQDNGFVAIVGFGGIGKTTLAMELYRKVGHQFKCRASVQASQKFNLLVLLRSLVKQFHEQQVGPSENIHIDGIEEWGEKRLSDKLVDLLKGKRYLILIDDVCTVSAWRNIHNCLTGSINGTVVVTTRSKPVAVACCHKNGILYEHKPLSQKASYKLFHQSYPAREGLTEVNIGATTSILQKCGGLPLAIILVAGMIASRVRLDPDTKEFDNHIHYVSRTLDGGMETHLSTEVLTQFLEQCYNDLPGELKTCLLYLSIFPNGRSISRKRLMGKWVTEGFLCERYGNTMEENAEKCFNELTLRNLIQVVSRSTDGKVKNCRIHDMVHEYIVSKSSQENFSTVVGDCFRTINQQVLATIYRVRCLSVHRGAREEKEALDSMKLSNVRSLTAFESFKALHSSLPKFKILQVLDLESCSNLSSSHVNKICKMHQLKYLSLRGTDITEIPPEIDRMEYLELLDIRETKVTTLPPSVKWLKRMAHLLAGDRRKCITLELSKEITEMTALQTLSGVEIRGYVFPSMVRSIRRGGKASRRSSKEVLQSLEGLTQLEKFRIYIVGVLEEADQELLLCAIEQLYSLKFLAIEDYTGFLDTSFSSSKAPPEYMQTLVLSGLLHKVPRWILCLHSLQKLTLPLCSFSTDTLLLICDLPELLSLTFSQREDTSVSEGEIDVPDRGFRMIKLLRFFAPVVPSLRFVRGAMPGLQKLEMRFRTADGVHGLENLASLRQVLLTVSSIAPSPSSAEEIRRLANYIPENPPTVIIERYIES